MREGDGKKRSGGQQRNIIFIVALVAIVAGTSVYLFVREPIYGIIVHVREYFSVNSVANASWLSHSTPTFAHALLFPLLCSFFLPKKQLYYVLSVSIWVAVDVFFELLQKDGKGNIVVEYISNLPVCHENCFNYLHYGTYDFNDIISILLGGILAYMLLTLTQKRRR